LTIPTAGSNLSDKLFEIFEPNCVFFMLDERLLTIPFKNSFLPFLILF